MLAGLVATVQAATPDDRLSTLYEAARDGAAVIASRRSSRRTVATALLAAAATAGLPEREALPTIAAGLHAGGDR